jgi:hypothetical protein
MQGFTTGGNRNILKSHRLNRNQTLDWRNPFNLLMFIHHVVQNIGGIVGFNQYNYASPTHR